MQLNTKAVPAARNLIGWHGWGLVIGVAIVLRLIVMASGAVSFHSDEAIIGLMARHINLGLPIPTFFYGQAYMGSLDALLVSVSFRLFGESVLSIRLAQSMLYLLIVLTTVLLAKKATNSAWAAIAAGLLVSVPPVLMTLYTSMTLGGYNETLLFGNIVLMLGWDLTNAGDSDRRVLACRWALLGLVGGLGWWTDGLILVYLLPTTLYLLWRLLLSPHLAMIRYAPYVALAGAMFVIGGLPWWWYNLSNNWDALRFLIGGAAKGNGIDISPLQRLLNLLFIGLPAVLGVRFPWSGAMWAGIGVGIVLMAYTGVVGFAIAQARRRLVTGANNKQNPSRYNPALIRAARFLLLASSGTIFLFVVSAFGVDVSGRYLLPLVPLLAILTALCADSLVLPKRRHLLGQALIGGLLAVALLGNAIALTTVPPGLTSQFDPANDFPNTSDQALIDFLLAHNGARGYGTYWVTFRIAFVSQERVILDAWLPNKTDLRYTAVDRRYPPYTELVNAAQNRVYVTANMPQLDGIIADKFAQAGITYERQTIGPYTVFFDLSAIVAPDALGLESISLTEQHQ